jgi:polar amino acid transport system permease protein
MWSTSYAWSLVPTLLRGLETTVEATLGAAALALILGALLAMVRRSSIAVVRIVFGFIVQFIRSTPLLVQVFFWFYVLPNWGITLSALLVGILGLGLHYGCYMAEVYRAGIESVPRSQWEAAEALHFNHTQRWIRIILPQAIRTVTPVLGNYVIAAFKDSAILSAIGLTELMTAATNAGALSFRYLEPLTVAGLLYLIVSLIASFGVRGLERYLVIPGR